MKSGGGVRVGGFDMCRSVGLEADYVRRGQVLLEVEKICGFGGGGRRPRSAGETRVICGQASPMMSSLQLGMQALDKDRALPAGPPVFAVSGVVCVLHVEETSIGCCSG